MFELPECLNLTRQMREVLEGKRVAEGERGNTPHKFVWYNRDPDEFRDILGERTIGRARARGRWMFVPLDPGYVLVLGECGGRILYHLAGDRRPASYHLRLEFSDGSGLTVKTQMWGAMELYEKGKEEERDYIKGMRPTPVDPEFTFAYFSSLIDSVAAGEKLSVKGLLTQDQLVPGLGNSSAQEILFRAGLHPKHSAGALGKDDRRRLFDSLVDTVAEIADAGGRSDEFDLYGNRGGYRRVMDGRAVGLPCPRCGTSIEKISYLGGACYFCPSCQPEQ